MVFAGLLKEPSLPPEMLDLSCFWHGIDGGLADKWLTRSRPSLFLLPGGRLRLARLVLLHLRYKARLGCIVK